MTDDKGKKGSNESGGKGQGIQESEFGIRLPGRGRPTVPQQQAPRPDPAKGDGSKQDGKGEQDGE